VTERRSELRMTPARQVRVVLKDGPECCLGTLSDISLSGARVKIRAPIKTGRQLELIFDDHKQRFQCTVIWASDAEIGVRFDFPATTPPPSA
jgi:hypothetical protein